jgi:hypothetical protein
MTRVLRTAALTMCAAALLSAVALAEQATPSAATPAASPATAPPKPAGHPQLPPNFDPCGGPQELLNKFGLTPCVVPLGEAMLSAGYSSANVNGTVTAGAVATLPVSALARQFP